MLIYLFTTSQQASRCAPHHYTSTVALSSFGNDTPSFQTLGLATIQIQTLNGNLVPISVLIVLNIAIPIQSSCHVEMEKMPHLKGLKLAKPITDSNEFIYSNRNQLLLVACTRPHY